MKFHAKEARLKNGKTVVIRQAVLQDAAQLLECVKTYIPQSDYIPKLATEIKLSIEQEAQWIRSFLEADNSLLLVAEYEGQLIGNIDLAGSPRKIMEHTAMIGMGMLQEWRNAGLGTALLSSVIDWAKAHPILELIWLQVYTQNELGMHLYRKLGFQESGVMPNFFKRDGRYFDNLTMHLTVKDIVGHDAI